MLKVSGDPFKDVPLIGTEKFVDKRVASETVNWQLVVTVPVDTYYGYIWQLMYITIGMTIVLVALVAWSAVAVATDAPEPTGVFAGVTAIVFVLYLLWQVTVCVMTRDSLPELSYQLCGYQVKYQTDSLTEQALTATSDM